MCRDGRPDFRLATRQFSRRCLQSCAKVLIDAFALTGSGSVFALVDSFWLPPLPFQEPDSLYLEVWPNQTIRGRTVR